MDQDCAVRPFFLGLMFFRAVIVQSHKVEQIPHSEFRALLEAGKISEVVVGPTTLHSKLVKARGDGKSEFVTNKLSPDIADYLAKYNVRYSGEADTGWLSAILS